MNRPCRRWRNGQREMKGIAKALSLGKGDLRLGVLRGLWTIYIKLGQIISFYIRYDTSCLITDLPNPSQSVIIALSSLRSEYMGFVWQNVQTVKYSASLVAKTKPTRVLERCFFYGSKLPLVRREVTPVEMVRFSQHYRQWPSVKQEVNLIYGLVS